MHLIRWILLVKRTLAIPYFLSYVDFKSAEKVRFPRTCFTTHMLQNKGLSRKQWHHNIGYVRNNPRRGGH